MADHDGDASGRAGSRPPAPEAAPQVASGFGVALRRIGRAVEITLTSSTEYASIELYDSLVQSVKAGRLRLELNLPRS